MTVQPFPTRPEPLRGLGSSEHACLLPNPGETTAIFSWDGTGMQKLHDVVAHHSGETVAMITQDPRVDPNQTVAQHVAGRPFVEEIATSLGLVGHEHVVIGTLSPAMQQRVQVCRELASSASLVAAFDPFVHLEERDARMLQIVLRAAAVECRRTIVYATSDAHTASRAHRAIVVKGGHVIADVRGASAPELAGLLF